MLTTQQISITFLITCVIFTLTFYIIFTKLHIGKIPKLNYIKFSSRSTNHFETINSKLAWYFFNTTRHNFKSPAEKYQHERFTQEILENFKFQKFENLADAELLTVQNLSSAELKFKFLKLNSQSSSIFRDKNKLENYNSKYPIIGDYAIDFNFLFPKLKHHPEHGRVFNPAIDFFEGNLHLILRFNQLVQEIGSLYLRNSKYFVKNNTLISTVLTKRELAAATPGLLVQPFFNENQSDSSATFDCEADPDWQDGGHGIQDPRIFQHDHHKYLIFNSRIQTKKFPELCPENAVSRKIFVSQLKLDWATGLVIGWESPIQLNIIGSLDVPWKNSGVNTAERNWAPVVLKDPTKNLINQRGSLSILLALSIVQKRGSRKRTRKKGLEKKA